MARQNLDEMSYYEVLGVEAAAPVEVIKQAFHAFARKYHPDRHVLEPELHRKSVYIYRRGTEAYRVLLNAEARRLYDQGLAQGRVRFDPGLVRASMRPGAAVSDSRAPSNRSRSLLEAAAEAMRRHDYDRAEQQLLLALEYEPGNPELEAMLRRVRGRVRARARAIAERRKQRR